MNDDHRTGSKVQATRKAAVMGDPKAQLMLGVMYYDGNGVPQSFREAFEWMLRSAEQENAMAQYNVGWMYANGEGVGKNLHLAAAWYRKAANRGFAKAQYYLAKSHAEGSGVERNQQEAIYWYGMAAKSDYADAFFALAEVHFAGIGVPRNYDLALSWIRKASNRPELSDRANEMERMILDAKAKADRERENQEKANRRESNPLSFPKRDEKYYGKVLGLKGEVSKEDVRRRYRELVSQYHPDKVNHLGPKLRELAEKEMKEINEAYAYFKQEYGIV